MKIINYRKVERIEEYQEISFVSSFKEKYKKVTNRVCLEKCLKVNEKYLMTKIFFECEKNVF